jgi:hypothetical protein
MFWNDAQQVRLQTIEVYLMNKKLERDRGQIESAIVDAYVFWLRSGMPSINQSFDDGGSHYEWFTDIISQNGEPAWSIGECPQIEDVNEKILIHRALPRVGRGLSGRT